MDGFLEGVSGILKIILVLFFCLYAYAIVGGVICKALIIVIRAIAFPALLGMAILPSLAHRFFDRWPYIYFVLVGIENPNTERVEIPEKGIFRIAQDVGGALATSGIVYGAFLWTQRGFHVMWAEVSWLLLIPCTAGVRLIPVFGKMDVRLGNEQRDGYRPSGIIGIIDQIDRMELPKLFGKITG